MGAPSLGGGGVLPKIAYTGRLRPKGESFAGFRYLKGQGFYSFKYTKGLGKSVIWVCERTEKAEQMNFITL